MKEVTSVMLPHLPSLFLGCVLILLSCSQPIVNECLHMAPSQSRGCRILELKGISKITWTDEKTESKRSKVT